MSTSPRLHSGDVVRIRGDRWTVARHVAHGGCALVEARGCDRANRGERVTFILPAEHIERLSASATPKVVRPARWLRTARAALGDAVPSPSALMTAARASFDILPFQLEAALAVTSGAACRLLIADEVGLGKTLQAALVVTELLERHPDGHALIVTPAGLRHQWREEIARWFARRVAVIDSASLSQTSTGLGDTSPWIAQPIAITSIDFVKRPEVLRSLEPLVWEAIVFDEAHALAGPSDRHQAADALAARARHVLLLTATPHNGDDGAFERLGAIGDSDASFPLLLFRRTRADAGLPSSRRTKWLTVRLSGAERRMHRALTDYARVVWREREAPAAHLAMSVLARRAASSAASLALSVERRLALLPAGGMEAAQLRLPILDFTDDDHPDGLLAVPGLHDGDREREWLRRLLALARIASAAESKVAALLRLLRRARTPALVFTEYRDTLERVSAQLRGRVVHLHGGLTMAERQQVASEFTCGDADVMLATDAASEGLNLQRRCRLVVNLELPWNPVRLEQRIGRVDRIGQRGTVHAVHFVAGGTIEKHVVERLLRRASHARTALGDDRPYTEDDVAAHALGDRHSDAHVGTASPHLRTCTPAPPHLAPPHLAPPHLHTLATAEAARLATARALLRGRDEAPLVDRPQLTIISRRHVPRSSCWTFRVLIGSDEAEFQWETLLGVCALASAPAVRTRRDVRVALSVHADVESAADAAAHGIEQQVREALARVSALQAAREGAISRDVEERQARMAAAVLQPSLFDRRAERAAAAQQSVAAEALGACAQRLARLDALSSLVVQRRELAFAVVLA